MCSNYQPIKKTHNPWVKKNFGVELPDTEWKGHVWAMDKAPFIFLNDGQARCELGKFGMEPHWAKNKPNFGRRTYNARSETVDEKPSYRSAWKSRHFGLVLAEQFFEPYYADAETKPVWSGISRSDGEPVAIGSIWDRYENHDTGENIFSFSMLTINSDHHDFMKQFHKPGDEKRSVVIVENDNFNMWLKATHDEARALMKLSPDGYLVA